MSSTHNLLTQILSLFEKNNSDLGTVAAQDIISTVYIELQSMTQL